MRQKIMKALGTVHRSLREPMLVGAALTVAGSAFVVTNAGYPWIGAGFAACAAYTISVLADYRAQQEKATLALFFVKLLLESDGSVVQVTVNHVEPRNG